MGDMGDESIETKIERMREELLGHRAGRDYVRSRTGGLIEEAPIKSVAYLRGMADELQQLANSLFTAAQQHEWAERAQAIPMVPR